MFSFLLILIFVGELPLPTGGSPAAPRDCPIAAPKISALDAGSAIMCLTSFLGGSTSSVTCRAHRQCSVEAAWEVYVIKSCEGIRLVVESPLWKHVS